MRRWWQLGTRNWRHKPGRSASTVIAVAVGCMLVVAVLTCYASARAAVTGYLSSALGRADVTVQIGGHSPELMPEALVAELRAAPSAVAVVPRLRRIIDLGPPPTATQPSDHPLANQRLSIEAVGMSADDARIRPLDLVVGRVLADADGDVAILQTDMQEQYGLDVGHTLVLTGEGDRRVSVQIVGIVRQPTLGRMQRRTVYVPLATLQRLANAAERVQTIDLLARDGELLPLKNQAEQIVGAYRAELAEQIRTLTADRRALLEKAAEVEQKARDNPFDRDLRMRAMDAQLRSVDASIERLRVDYASAMNIEVAQRDLKVAKVTQSLGLMDLVLRMTACVALISAMFITFSTLNISVTERITQLGVLRCLGMTRLQAGTLVFVEALPLGLLGVLIGVPAGLGVAYFAVQYTDDVARSLGANDVISRSVFGDFTIHWPGVALAVVGGALAVVAAAIFPAISAARVSPLQACRPLAEPTRRHWLLGAASLGMLIVIAHALGMWLLIDRHVERAVWVHLFAGIPLVMVAVVLLAPGLLAVLTFVFIRPIAAVMHLSRAVLTDQFGKLHWRSAGVVCAVMVGLALMVSMQIYNATVMNYLQLPKKFPSALAWCWEPPLVSEVQKLQDRVLGVRDLTAMSTANIELVNVAGQDVAGVWKLFGEQTPKIHLVSTDPAEWPRIIGVDFVAGDEETALAALRNGRGAIVTREFANAYRKTIGDTIDLRRPGGESTSGGVGLLGRIYNPFDRGSDDAPEPPGPLATYTIAGVIVSPGVEVVADFFDQRQALQERAIGGVVISRENGERDFGLLHAPILLYNFDMPKLRERYPGLSDADLEERAQRNLGAALRTHKVFSLTATAAKQILEHDVGLVGMLLTGAGAIALGSAALGAANVMLANVVSRGRQLAMLRAIGMTRGQVIRLVLAEGVLLGLAGGVIGVLVGAYLAYIGQNIAKALLGVSPVFTVPWLILASAIALTVLATTLAALTPARLAARSSVIDGLRH